MKSISVKKDRSTNVIQLLCLFAVLCLGLFFRLGTALGTQIDTPIRADARDYVAYAWNLKAYDVYSSDASALFDASAKVPVPDASRPPGYPLLLDALMSSGSINAFVARVCLAQAWMAELTLLCATLLAMDLLGAWMGLLLGFLVAISPHQSVYVGYLLTETFFGLAIMLALMAGVYAIKAGRPGWRYALASLSGLFFGLSCLIRPTLDQWVLFLVLIPFFFVRARPFRREIAALVMGFMLTMSPWWIRNQITLHHFSDSGKMINTLHDGSYPDFMYKEIPDTFGYPYRFDPNTQHATSSWSGIYDDLKVKFSSNPWGMFRWYFFGKISYFFGWSSAEGWGDVFIYPALRSPWLWQPAFLLAKSIMRAIYAPLIICGVLGMLLAFFPVTEKLFGHFQASAARSFALLQFFAIAVHLLGAPFARYSVPFKPVTLTLAVFFLVWGFRYCREHWCPVSIDPVIHD